MKIVSFLRRQDWKGWSLVFIFVGWQIFAAFTAYPTSDAVINPVTGKYDPALEEWVAPITSAFGNTVDISLGDRAGAANSIGRDVLFVLSPALRMHPKSKVFIVRWSMVCCTDGGSGGGEEKLIYHRDSGQVFHHLKGFFQREPYEENHLIAVLVRDRRIHRMAARGGSFGGLALGF